MKLTIEYVPVSSWNRNLRYPEIYSPYEWQKISKKVQLKANYVCEICGRKKDGNIITKLYCHEVWSYNLSMKIQRLEKLQCLCFECHSVIHFGFSKLQGYDIESLKQHFIKVNDTDLDGFNEHLNESNELYAIREKVEWIVDFNGFDKIDTTSPYLKAMNEKRESAYIVIKNYLNDNPKATNSQIQKATGVTLSSIRSYFINLYGLK